MTDLRVLIVEDDTSAAQLMKKLLREIGIHQVYTAADGKEALEFMGSCEDLYDLVLCDWNMPRMNGLELLQQVRSTGSDLPFLMVTGVADKQSVLEAKNHGVTSYIVKPFSQKQLEAKLNAITRMLTHQQSVA